MGIGVSIFFIAFGIILAFGVDLRMSWISIPVCGWILILGGTAGLLGTVHLWRTRRRHSPVVPIPVEPPIPEDERRIEYHPPE